MVDILLKIGAPADSLTLAAARGQVGEMLVAQGQWEEALDEFEAIRQGLANDAETFDRFFAANLSWALALRGAERAGDARAIAKSALERNQRTVGHKHYNTAEARGVMAMALAELGKRKEALAAFTEAVPILLSRSRQADDENTTISAKEHRLDLILESYIGLLVDIRGTAIENESSIDATAEAFRLADVARDRSVQRALSASGARAAARDLDLAALVRREQDAQKQVAALYGLLANIMSAPTDQRDPEAIQDLRVHIDNLRGARATLLEEIEARFPDYADLINPRPGMIEEARAALRPGEAC